MKRFRFFCIGLQFFYGAKVTYWSHSGLLLIFILIVHDNIFAFKVLTDKHLSRVLPLTQVACYP